MATQKNGRVALFAIRPQYAEPILTGKKTVEFRKCKLDSGVRWIVIYASSPISAIIGIVEVGQIIEDKPAQLWVRFGKRGCIAQKDFDDYYQSKSKGVAIEVHNPRRFKQAVAVKEFGCRPPQSFCYLDPDIRNTLLTELIGQTERP